MADLLDAVAAHQCLLVAAGVGPAVRERILRHACLFLGFLQRRGRGSELDQLRPCHVCEFLAWLRLRGVSESDAYAAVDSVTRLSQDLTAAEVLDADPLGTLAEKPPRDPVLVRARQKSAT